MENNCPHCDYGKSADKSLGAYCTEKKKCVELEDCDRCEEELTAKFVKGEWFKNQKEEKQMELKIMAINEMISQLDGACGRMLVASMRDPVIREAMEMVTEVSIALGEMSEEE